MRSGVTTGGAEPHHLSGLALGGVDDGDETLVGVRACLRDERHRVQREEGRAAVLEQRLGHGLRADAKEERGRACELCNLHVATRSARRVQALPTQTPGRSVCSASAICGHAIRRSQVLLERAAFPGQHQRLRPRVVVAASRLVVVLPR